MFGPEEYTAVFGGKTRKVWVRLGGGEEREEEGGGGEDAWRTVTPLT